MPDTKHAIEALEKAKLRAQDELRYAGAQGPVLTYIAELDDAIALLRSPSAEVPRVIDDDAISVKAIEVHGETTHAVAFFNGAEWYRDSTTPAPMDYRMSREVERAIRDKAYVYVDHYEGLHRTKLDAYEAGLRDGVGLAPSPVAPSVDEQEIGDLKKLRNYFGGKPGASRATPKKP